MKVNTELCVNLKTKLQNDVIMIPGKEYTGVLRHDKPKETLFGPEDSHFTFRETQPSSAGKRNTHVFVGKYITITRRDDGSLRPNFKPLKVDKRFSIISYAVGVANELLWALTSLLGK